MRRRLAFHAVAGLPSFPRSRRSPWMLRCCHGHHRQLVRSSRVSTSGRRGRGRRRRRTTSKRSPSEVGKRGEALRQEALDTRTAAQSNRARVGSVKTGGAKGAFDFDAMIAGADAAAAGAKLERPKLIVFASLSMPVPSLKTLFRDVTKAGGVVVFRGFKNGSVKDFMAGLAPAFRQG